MTQTPLFDSDGPSDASDTANPAQPPQAGRGRPRYQRAVRDQIEFQPYAIDELLPADHQARPSGRSPRRPTWPPSTTTSRRSRGTSAATRSTRESSWPCGSMPRSTASAASPPRRPLQTRPGLSLVVRRGLGELPHAVRLPRRARRPPQRPPDRQRRGPDASGTGRPESGRPGWHAGACQRRHELVPRPCHPRTLPRRGEAQVEALRPSSRPTPGKAPVASRPAPSARATAGPHRPGAGRTGRVRDAASASERLEGQGEGVDDRSRRHRS